MACSEPSGARSGTVGADKQPSAPATCSLKLTLQQQKVVLDNLRLARWWAVRWATRLALKTHDLEDLEAEARLALIRAVATWRPEIATLATYAGTCCNRACRAWARKLRQPPKSTPQRGSDPLNSRGQTPFVELKAEPAEPASTLDTLDKLALAEALDQLTRRQREILRLRYGLAGEVLTLREAAKRLGVSHWQVGLEQREALAELRQRLR